MTKSIDWLYQRKSCATCQKARDHLAAAAVPVAESVDAVKVRMDPTEALALLEGMTKLVAAKGKSVVELDLIGERPDDATLLKHLIGPTGNLRAPTAKVGTVVLVGFHPGAYDSAL